MRRAVMLRGADGQWRKGFAVSDPFLNVGYTFPGQEPYMVVRVEHPGLGFIHWPADDVSFVLPPNGGRVMTRCRSSVRARTTPASPSDDAALVVRARSLYRWSDGSTEYFDTPSPSEQP